MSFEKELTVLRFFRSQASPFKKRLNRLQAATRPVAEGLERRQLLSTVVVNTTADKVFPAGSGFISLRNALTTASDSASTTITFDKTVFATAQTITLSGSELLLQNDYSSAAGVYNSTTIVGPSAGVTIDGNDKSRGLDIEDGRDGGFVEATISNVNVTNCIDGGIYAVANLTLNNSVISNNSSTGYGGGLYNDGGTATLTDVTVQENTAMLTGGGIYNDGVLNLTDVSVVGNSVTGTVQGNANLISGGGFFNAAGEQTDATLVNVTIANNKSTGYGGGLTNYANGSGAILSMHQVTIADNSSAEGGGGFFIDDASSDLHIGNTIIADNTAGNGYSGPDVYGAAASEGFNLIGKTDGSTGFSTADFTGTIAHPLDPKLGSLADNGGSTKTLQPLTGSMAIDHGDNDYVPSGLKTDQRGLTRIVNGTVDIGAVEVQSTATPSINVTAPATQAATVGKSQSFSLGSFTEANATGPYTVAVNWGDKTSNTYTVTSSGTLPSESHTYASTGSDTVSVVLSDSTTHSNTAAFGVTVAGTSPTLPAAPNNLVATANSGTQVTLTWVDKSNNETAFTIQRSASSTFSSPTTFTAAANATSYIDTTTTKSTYYYYRVGAANAAGTNYSKSVKIKTLSTTSGGGGGTGTTLATPTSLAGTAVAGPSVSLKWTDNASGETGYEIEVSTVSTFATLYKDITVNTPNLAAYMVTGLAAKGYYYFRVRAVSSTPSLDSAWSSSVKIKTLSA